MHKGRADDRSLTHSRRVSSALRINSDRKVVAGRRGHARQGQSRRICDGFVEHNKLLRPGREPLAPAGGQPAVSARRILGRIRGGGCRARGGGGDRYRYRRLDPSAGELLRHRRFEADLWPLLALGGRRVCLLARPSGADDPNRARCRDHAAQHGRSRLSGLDLGAAARAGLRDSVDRRHPRVTYRHPARIPCP